MPKSYHPKPGYCRTAVGQSQDRNDVLRLEVRNLLTNGRKEVREIIDDASAVNREMWKAVEDIADRNNGLDQGSCEDDQDNEVILGNN